MMVGERYLSLSLFIHIYRYRYRAGSRWVYRVGRSPSTSPGRFRRTLPRCPWPCQTAACVRARRTDYCINRSIAVSIDVDVDAHAGTPLHTRTGTHTGTHNDIQDRNTHMNACTHTCTGHDCVGQGQCLSNTCPLPRHNHLCVRESVSVCVCMHACMRA